jgi:hypothetical protein
LDVVEVVGREEVAAEMLGFDPKVPIACVERIDGTEIRTTVSSVRSRMAVSPTSARRSSPDGRATG